MSRILSCLLVAASLVGLSVVCMSSAAAAFSMLNSGIQMTWDEYSFGDFTAEATTAGVTVVGSYDSSNLMPGSVGWSTWELRSQELFLDSLEFSADLTITGYAGTEVFASIGVRAPNEDANMRGDILEFGPYFYLSHYNAIGYRNSFIDGILDRQFPDDTDIVVDLTLRYSIVVDAGYISYYIDDVEKFSEPMPFSSFNIHLISSAKYEGTSVSVAFENVYVMGEPFVSYDFAGLTWREYEWGSLTSSAISNGVEISGTYDSQDTTPYTGDFNNYFLLSTETFSDSLWFSSDVTVPSFGGTEAIVGIGLRSPSEMDFCYRDSILWCWYYYESQNSVGWLHECLGGDYSRTTVDDTDLVFGQTYRYEIHLDNGVLDFFIDGEWKTSMDNPLTEFNLFIEVAIKYEGTYVEVAFDDISINDIPPESYSPTAAFTYTPPVPRVGETVSFNASSSYDSDGLIVGYSWDFGDGSSGNGILATHEFSSGGSYSVTLTVMDDSEMSSSLTRTVTVVVEPLDVQVCVGSIHFGGEIAEFYILVSSLGILVDAEIDAKLYFDGLLYEVLSSHVENVGLGLYRIPYTVPLGASAGTYALEVEAHYLNLNGCALSCFLVSPTLTGWNALLIGLNETVATISTDVGAIQVAVEDLDARLTNIGDDMATIDTSIGSIQTTLSLIEAEISTINGSLVLIETAVGSIQVTLDSIEARISSINETLVTIETSLGAIAVDIADIQLRVAKMNGSIATIETTLGSIEGRVLSIDDGMALIQTDLGVVKADVSALDVEQQSLATNLYYLVAAVAGIAIVVAIITWMARKKQSP